MQPSLVASGPGSEQFPRSPLGEQTPGIPTGRDVEWEPLVDYRRFGVSETTIHGAVAWATPKGVFHSFGGNVLCYGRSMMKPLMMKVFTGVLDDLTSQQKAISVASHNGDVQHVAAAQSLLDETEWGLMQAPLDTPLVQFGRQVRRPRRWYHTCSGEHAAILRGCRRKGWPRIGYLLPQHPWFQEYLDIVRDRLDVSSQPPEGRDERRRPRPGAPGDPAAEGHGGPSGPVGAMGSRHADATDGRWQPVRVARDGCGLPTLSNTVSELATLYAGLARDHDEDWIWNAMVAHPDLVGGFNRLDTTILKAGDGHVIAKEGADGLLGMAIRHDDFPDGLGVVVKIAHGWDAQATWYVARAVLGTLGIQLRNPYKLHRQKAFIVPGVVPPDRLEALARTPTWDEWDPDTDRWYYDWTEHAGSAVWQTPPA